MYSFDENGFVLSKDGAPFFNNPFGLFGKTYLGIEMPKGNLKGGGLNWHTRTEVILGGGECCHGFVMAISPRGSVECVLELDINVAAIVPLVHEDGQITLLVSGQGCDGSGLRHVDFRMNPFPTVSQIVAGEEAHALLPSWPYLDSPSWFLVHPLDVSEVWDLLAAHGLMIDREKTEAMQQTCSAFGRKGATRGWLAEWRERAKLYFFLKSLRQNGAG